MSGKTEIQLQGTSFRFDCEGGKGRGRQHDTPKRAASDDGRPRPDEGTTNLGKGSDLISRVQGEAAQVIGTLRFS